MVEVDIHLPEEYHTRLMDSFPCLVSKRLIKFSDLSKHQVKIAKALNKKQDIIPKVVASLDTGYKIKLDWRYLKFLMKMNYQVLKIHRVLTFVVSPFLKKFVSITASLRTNATTAAASNSFKALNNSLYGRFLLSREKHRRGKLCFSYKDSLKCINKPMFSHSIEITKNTSLAVLKPRYYRVQDALYIGITTLQLAKLQMASFFHLDIAPIFSTNYSSISFIYGDTDSFAL